MDPIKTIWNYFKLEIQDYFSKANSEDKEKYNLFKMIFLEKTNLNKKKEIKKNTGIFQGKLMNITKNKLNIIENIFITLVNLIGKKSH